MKIIKTAILFALAFMAGAQAYASCTNPDDRAADGSRCGGRSSSSRPGGK